MAQHTGEKNIGSDLGLGTRVVSENRTRFINHDGSFNVYRKGVFERGSFSPYHALLNLSWQKFFLGVFIYYFLVNLLFTVLYLLSGKGAFPQIAGLSVSQRFGQLFFYSIQIISTLGSSPLHPTAFVAEALLALESLVGLFGFAVGASLLFARFSNPTSKILFSDKAVIAPYGDITGFMIRIINGRNNELINVSAIATLSWVAPDGTRDFSTLKLERDMVQTFPLNWTIVHPIEPGSPLHGKTIEDLHQQNAELVVNITAIDPDLSKTIYVRSSYKGGEIVKAKFVNILEMDENGTVNVDPRRISEIEQY